MDCLTLNCIFVFISLWKGYNCKRLANALNGCGGLTLARHQNCSITFPLLNRRGEKMQWICILIHASRTGRSLSSYSHTVKTDVVWGNYFKLLPIKSEIMRIKNKSLNTFPPPLPSSWGCLPTQILYLLSPNSSGRWGWCCSFLFTVFCCSRVGSLPQEQSSAPTCSAW